MKHNKLYYLIHPAIGFDALMYKVSDKYAIKKMFKSRMGYELDLDNPQTFCEKLQWLKLYDRNPIYHKWVDKAEAKQLTISKIGGKLQITKTLGLYNDFGEIDFAALPNQFVLKCTHDSGSSIICKDKAHFDFKSAKTKIDFALSHDYYTNYREWPYKKLKRRIIAEEYLEDDTGELRDYKFFCFNGEVKMFKVDFNRYIEHHANYYDTKGELLPFGECVCPPQLESNITIPICLNEMISLAEILSVGIPFCRIDFYYVNEHIYFGECTFFPNAGLGKWTTDDADILIGSWLTLPTKERQ